MSVRARYAVGTVCSLGAAIMLLRGEWVVGGLFALWASVWFALGVGKHFVDSELS